MSDEYDVVRGNSSSSTSTTGSFENIDTTDKSQSSVSVTTSGENVAGNLVGEDLPTKAAQDEKCCQEQTYTAIRAGHAISNLIKFSAAMFVLPLLTMLTMYHYVFRDYFNFPPDEAMLYAGMCGVAVVIVIAILFVYVAYREEIEDEKMKLDPKKLQ